MDDYRQFAIDAHGDQMYGNQPYAAHLNAVAEVLLDFGFSDDTWQAAAWLHDVVEDTDTTQAHVHIAFGWEVAALVHAVTGEGANRREKQASIIAKLHINKSACILKLADRIANLEAAIMEQNASGKMAMYYKELPAFEKVVRKHTPPAMWDRLCDAFEYGKSKGWI